MRSSPIKQPINFNSQPREGGWVFKKMCCIFQRHFNSQPREGGWHGMRYRQSRA